MEDQKEGERYLPVPSADRERRELETKYIMMWELGVMVHRQCGSQYTSDIGRVVSSVCRAQKKTHI